MVFLKKAITQTKEVLGLIQFPPLIELGVIVAMVTVYAFMNAFSICGDCFFGYAITERLVNPSLYHANDVLVNGGAGNFLLYRLLSLQPFFSNNYNLRDFVFSTPLTFLLILAWYNVFRVLVNERKIVLMSLFFLLFSDTKLFLHGYPIPFFIFTSIGSVHFLQIFALFYFFRARYVLSFILLGLSAYMHPASGFVFLAILFGCLLLEAYRTKSWNMLWPPVVAACVVMIPNIYMLGTNLVLSGEERELFYAIMFQIRQVSALFVGSYLSHTYAYTFSALALVLVLYHKKKFQVAQQDMVLRFIILGFVGSIIWIGNFYAHGSLQIYYTTFVARAFYIIKPLMILYIVLVFDHLFSRRSWVAKILAILLAVSVMTLPSSVGALILLCVTAVYVFEGHLTHFWKMQTESEQKMSLKILLVALVCLAGLFGYLRNNKFYKVYQLIRGNNVFNFSFDFDRNYSVSRTNPAFSELVDWAKQFKGKMFLVPIDGRNDFVYFRYFTKNGMYANIDDMGQLSYSPKEFLEGYRRLSLLGFKITGEQKLDFSGYNTLRMSVLKATGADFAIFDKHSPGFESRGGSPVFETERYVVYDLKS